MNLEQEFEFHEVVARVEQRFRPELDDEARERLRGTDTQPGKYEPAEVSTGWWVVLSRFGIAVRFGNMKPDIEAGDTLVLTARKIPKKPDAPDLAVVPPAPPPIDVETARQIWLDHLATLSPEKRAETMADFMS